MRLYKGLIESVIFLGLLLQLSPLQANQEQGQPEVAQCIETLLTVEHGDWRAKLTSGFRNSLSLRYSDSPGFRVESTGSLITSSVSLFDALNLYLIEDYGSFIPVKIRIITSVEPKFESYSFIGSLDPVNGVKLVAGSPETIGVDASPYETSLGEFFSQIVKGFSAAKSESIAESKELLQRFDNSNLDSSELMYEYGSHRIRINRIGYSFYKADDGINDLSSLKQTCGQLGLPALNTAITEFENIVKVLAPQELNTVLHKNGFDLFQGVYSKE